MNFAIHLYLGLGLDRISPPVERDNIRINHDGSDGAGSVGELFSDEQLGAAVLKHEEHESVPDDALEHDNLDHETAREFTVHALEERDAHDESVGQSGDGEESDGPLEGAAAAQVAPGGENGECHELLEGVGGDEFEVHLVGVVGGDEVEGEERHGEERDEAVDAGALIGGEDLPPLDRAVSEDHGNVQRHHRRHDVVEIERSDHLDLIIYVYMLSLFFLCW